jgi:hypothetical protein
MKKLMIFLLLVLIVLNMVSPISADTLGENEISTILNTHTENQLRFQRNYSQKQLELSGDFEKLRPQGSDWAFIIKSEGNMISCVLSENEAMVFVEMARGANIFVNGKINKVRDNEEDGPEPILELKKCQIEILFSNKMAIIPMEGRWKGCNVRIGKKKYKGETCSLYVTIKKGNDAFIISDLKRSDGRPIKLVTAKFVSGNLVNWSTKTIQTGVITSYACEFKEMNPNSFACKWQEPQREGDILFQRLR